MIQELNRQQKYALVLQLYETFEQELIASTTNQTDIDKVKGQYQYAKNGFIASDRNYISPSLSRFNFLLAGVLAYLTYGKHNGSVMNNEWCNNRLFLWESR